MGELWRLKGLTRDDEAHCVQQRIAFSCLGAFVVARSESMDKQSSRFHFLREVLLIEIERRCIFVDCQGRHQIGLTKAEAIEYRGFHCPHCERWNDDRLKQSELPDSWPAADNSIAH